MRAAALLLRPHRHMFYSASSFNGNVSQWNGGKVTTMERVSAVRAGRGREQEADT